MDFKNSVALFLTITFVLHGLAFTILAFTRRKPYYFLLTGTFTLLTTIYFIKFAGWTVRVPGTSLSAIWLLRIGAGSCTLIYLWFIYNEEGSWLWKLMHRSKGQ